MLVHGASGGVGIAAVQLARAAGLRVLGTAGSDEGRAAVGMLWIAGLERAGQRIAYVYDISVRPEHRRKGHAASAFAALEGKVRELGLSGIALHVFGHNAGAVALYTKLGYQATNINMFKAVDPQAG